MDTLRNEENKKGIEKKAFLFCLLIAAAVFIPKMIMSHGYFALSFDFSAEQIPYGMLMNRAIKNGELWNWGIDLGGNLLEAFSFYNIGSPFMWLSFLFPAEWYPRLIGWIFILKFAVAGWSSALWMKRYLHKRTSVLVGAMLYAFSGAQCINIVFYHFQDVIAFFPLMLVELDKHELENKKGGFAVACALNLMCNPIFFFGSACFTILYYIIRYFIPNIKSRTQWTRAIGCFWEAGIGALICGVLLVPTLFGMMSNSRATASVATKNWFSIDTMTVLIRSMGFFFPSDSMGHYSAIKDIEWNSWNAYIPFFGLIFVLAYCIKERNWLRCTLIVCLVIPFITICNSAFVAFSQGNYGRWLYMATLLFALTTATVMEDISKYRDGIVKGGLVTTGYAVLYVLIVKMLPWNGNEMLPVFREVKFWFNIFSAIGAVALCIGIGYICKKRAYTLFVTAAVVASIALLGYSVYDYSGRKMDNTGIDFRTYPASFSENTVTYLTEVSEQLNRDILPYRYYMDEGIGYSYYNLAMTNDLPSINSFISTCHESIFELYDCLGNHRNNMTKAGYEGTDELLGVKHVLSQTSKPEYSLLNTFTNKNGQVYYLMENPEAIPFGGIRYDHYMLRSEFNTVDKQKRAEVMKRVLVVADENASGIDGLLEHVSAEDALTLNVVRNEVEFEKQKNGFDTIINTDADGYILYSVPYDKYWKCRVDDQTVDTMNTNGLTAVYVPKGVSKVSFSYEYTPMKYGIVLSCLGIFLFGVYMLLVRRYNIAYEKKQ